MTKIVLLAEDESLSQKLIASVLEHMGYETRICANGRDCVDALNKGLRPDLLLLDIEMPIMNGIEVMTELAKRKMTEDFPIVCLSTDNDKDKTTKALELGAHDYISKPFKVAELAKRISDFVFDVTNAEIWRLMHGLKEKDAALLRAPGLQSWNKKDYEAYPTTHGDKQVCVLLPKGQGPQEMAQLTLEELADAIHIFRKNAFGWRKIWPTFSVLQQKRAS